MTDRARAALPLAVLLLLATALQLLHVSQYSLVSVYDESPHFAYVQELIEGRVPAYGTIASEAARAEVTCRRWEAFEGFPCPSGDPLQEVRPAAEYPATAAVYVADHPPLYYAVAALSVAAGTLTGALDSAFVAARTSNLLWLWLGITATWLACGTLGASRRARTVGVAVVWLCPQTLYFASVTNPDIAVMAAGAGAAAGLTRWSTTGDRGWLVVLSCAVAAALKSTGVVVPVLCSLYLLLHVLQGVGRREVVARARSAAALLLACAAASAPVYLGWVLFQRARRTFDGYFTVDRTVEGFPFAGLVRPDNVYLLTDDLVGVYALGSSQVTVMGQLLLALAVVALCVWCMVLNGPRPAATTTALVALLGPVLATAAFVTVLYLSRDAYVPVRSRYLFAALPFVSVAVAAAVRRWPTWALLLLLAPLGALTAAYAVDLVRFE